MASINADMKVGGLAETITVTGETPIVDVQSVRRQNTLSNELLTTVPTARSWAAIAVLFQGSPSRPARARTSRSRRR